MDNKILYLKGGGKAGKYGDVNLSIKPSQLMKVLDFLNKKREEAGLAETEFLNIRVKERKEPGKYGDTHYATWELWFPEPKADEAPKKGQGPKPAPKPPVDDDDDLPF